VSAPRTSDEKLARRERSRASKARRNRIKHHPCPTCQTSGHIRRSFGFAYADDPRSETFQILVCPTCDGDGALPPDREPARLRAGERAATQWEVTPTVEQMDAEVDEILSARRSMGVFDVEDLDLDAIATEVGIEVDALVRELEGIRVGEDARD
jgi:hypothetical protein